MKRIRPLALLTAASLLLVASAAAAELADGYSDALKACLTEIGQKHPELAKLPLELYLDENLDAHASGQIAITLQSQGAAVYLGRCHVEHGALVRSEELPLPRLKR